MFAPRGWLSRSLAREMYQMFSLSPYFSRRWYRAHHLSGFLKWQDPIWHYIHHGGLTGLAPSLSFDSAYYLEKNDDVRVARLNPLFHFLAYGQAERRLPLRSAQEMVAALLPEAAPLRSFLTPQLDNPRVSVLVDSQTPESHRSEFIAAAQALALQHKATLRVLYRGIASPLPEIAEIPADKQGDLFARLEITPVPLTATYSDIPFYDHEVSIATSWSSAKALRFAAQVENSWFLTPEPEVPAGYELQKNTTELQNTSALRSRSWPSTLPTSALVQLAHQTDSREEWRLGVVAEANEHPLAFCIGLEAMSLWLAGAEGGVSIRFLGEPVAPFSFHEEFQPLPLSQGESVDCLLVLSSAALSDLERQGWDKAHIIQAAPHSAGCVEPNPKSIAEALTQAHLLWKTAKDTP